MKICPVGAELFGVDGRTDGRTHITKLIITFLYFANALNTLSYSLRKYIYHAFKFTECMFSENVTS